jgi:periodic tryptophan protein 1
MKRIPHSHDPQPQEVEGARARAEAEVEAESSLLLSDPSFASLRGVALPPGFMDDGKFEEAYAGTKIKTVAEGGVPGAFGRARAAATAAGGGGGAASTAAAAGEKNKEREEEEEEEEDEDEGLEEEDLADMEARPSDNFLVVANTADDFSGLEVYVYNEEDGSLYVHHDVTLPSFPVCLAWMDYAGDAAAPLLAGSGVCCPTQDGKSYVGSFCAVGSFDPSIEIWNLDIVDPLEPTLVLKGDKRAGEEGSGASGKGRKKGFAAKGASSKSASSAPSGGGHSAAVLGLSWNKTHRHLLASSGADGTCKVWDCDAGGRVLHTFTHHGAAKVHSCAWNPSEATVLAMASYDRTLAVVDARAGGDKVARYSLNADPECLLWHPHTPTHLLAAQSNGEVLCYDARAPAAPLWALQAHGSACTSISASATAQGLLATGGLDKSVKLWDMGSSSKAPVLLSTKAVAIGKVFTLSFFPGGDGGMLAAGGSKGEVALWNTGLDAGEVTAELVEGCTAAAAAVGGKGRAGDAGGGGGGGGGAAAEGGSSSLIADYFAPRLVPISSVPSGGIRFRADGQPLA